MGGEHFSKSKSKVTKLVYNMQIWFIDSEKDNLVIVNHSLKKTLFWLEEKPLGLLLSFVFPLHRESQSLMVGRGCKDSLNAPAWFYEKDMRIWQRASSRRRERMWSRDGGNEKRYADGETLSRLWTMKTLIVFPNLYLFVLWCVLVNSCVVASTNKKRVLYCLDIIRAWRSTQWSSKTKSP